MFVQPLTDGRVSELGNFLCSEFGHATLPAVFSDEVLRWKYLSKIDGEPFLPRSLLQIDGQKVVGHIGLNHRMFRMPGGAEVSTIHPMDWVAAKTYPGVGINLMYQCFDYAETQYALGGTEIAQRLQVALKFSTVAQIRQMRRVIRPLSRFKEDYGGSSARRLIAVLGDTSRSTFLRGNRHTNLELVQTHSFGPEVTQIVEASEFKTCHSTRSPGLLNHLLLYPGGTMTGWLVREQSDTVGFALLNIVEHNSIRSGRILECFLRKSDVRMWHGAIAAIVNELTCQGADNVNCLASIPWMADVLTSQGFTGRRTKHLRVRDPRKLLPTGATYHATHLEADLGYL